MNWLVFTVHRMHSSQLSVIFIHTEMYMRIFCAIFYQQEIGRTFGSVCTRSDAITCYACGLLSGSALCAMHINISESSAASHAPIQILQILLCLLDKQSYCSQ